MRCSADGTRRVLATNLFAVSLDMPRLYIFLRPARRLRFDSMVHLHGLYPTGRGRNMSETPAQYHNTAALAPFRSARSEFFGRHRGGIMQAVAQRHLYLLAIRFQHHPAGLYFHYIVRNPVDRKIFPFLEFEQFIGRLDQNP